MRAAMIRCCYGSVLAENTIVNTATFVKILGTGDTDVQRALQTIDAYNTPSEEASYPRGVEDIADSTLSFNTATQTLTMTPTGADFVIFEAGTGTVVKYTFAAAQSAAIAAPAAGAWWFYFDGGVLQAAQALPYGFRTTLVALVYLDVTLATIAVLDERHGINMPWQTHEYLHLTIGTRFENGFGITRVTSGNTGALDTDAQVIVTGGAIWDEDIQVPITRDVAPLARFEQELGDTPATPGRFPIYYRLGNDPNNWRKLAAIAAPLHNRAAPERPAYNSEAGGVWALTEISANNRYAIYWVCATNNLGNVDGAGTLCEPVFAIMGQGDYNFRTAQNASFADLQLGTFFANELKPLYKVIFRCSTGMANTYHAYVYEIDDLRNTAPLPGTSFVATDHQSLSGRTVVGAHPASAIVVDSAAFVGNLDINDDTVQKVAAKVDGLVIGGTVAFEDTVFVDKSGNDLTGVREDAALPFLTVGAALLVAQAGDTIVIGAGTFVEDLTLPNITAIHIRGRGRSITYLTAAVGVAITRSANSAFINFSITDCTVTGAAGIDMVISGAATAGGYAASDYAPLTVERCDFAGAVGSMLLQCLGYVRFENVTVGSDFQVREVGEFKVRNLRQSSGDIYNDFDILDPLPTGFLTGRVDYYSLKMDGLSTLYESGAIALTFDASCELATISLLAGDDSDLRMMGSTVETVSVASDGGSTGGDIVFDGSRVGTFTTVGVDTELNDSHIGTLDATGGASTLHATHVETATLDTVTFVASEGSFGTLTVEEGTATLTGSSITDAVITTGTPTLTFEDVGVRDKNLDLGSATYTTNDDYDGPWKQLPAITYDNVTLQFDTAQDFREWLLPGMPIRFFDVTGEIVARTSEIAIITAFGTLTGVRPILLNSGNLYVDVIDEGAGDFHIDIYKHSERLAGDLIGHSASYAAIGAKAIIADNGSGLGGTLNVLDLLDVQLTVTFYRYGIIDTVDSTGFTYLGNPVSASMYGVAMVAWRCDPSRVVQFTAVASGAFGAHGNESVLNDYMLQWPDWNGGPARAVVQSFSNRTDDNCGLIWQITDSAGFSYDASATYVVVAGPVLIYTSAMDIACDCRITSGSRLNVLKDGVNAAEEMTASLLLVLE